MKNTLIPSLPVMAIFAGWAILTFGCKTVDDNHEEISSVQVAEFIYEEAPFPECHASTVVELPDGTIAAAWFGGTEEKDPDVGIWFSRLEEGGWTTPVEVVNGVQSDTLRYPTWNPVLFQPENGPLYLYYKVGPNPQDWWGMYMTSADGGKTWSDTSRIGPNLIGPVKNKAIELSQGVIISPSSDEKGGEWTCHVEISKDAGKTWRRNGPLNNPDDMAAIQPAILVHSDGRLQMLCRSKQRKITTAWSSDQGETWSEMTLTNLPNPNSGIDAVTLRDGRHLLIYNPTVPPEGKWGGPRTPLVVAVSEDGENWRDFVVLENEEGEYSYPAIIQGEDGRVHITYTWKREKVKYVVLDVTQI